MATFEVYRVNCGFDDFLICVDLDEASAPISMCCGYANYDPGEPLQWSPTAFQTADARSLREAAILCVESCGKDWYCASDEDVEAEDVIVSVKPYKNAQ